MKTKRNEMVERGWELRKGNYMGWYRKVMGGMEMLYRFCVWDAVCLIG